MAKKNTTTAPEVDETQVVAPEATVEVTETEVVTEAEVEAAPVAVTEVEDVVAEEVETAPEAVELEVSEVENDLEGQEEVGGEDQDFTLLAPATVARLKALVGNITINSNGSETRTGGRLVQNLSTDTLGLESLTELLTLVKAL